MLRRYFEIAGFGNERALARILQIDPGLLEATARKLEREKIIVREKRIEGIPGVYSVFGDIL